MCTLFIVAKANAGCVSTCHRIISLDSVELPRERLEESNSVWLNRNRVPWLTTEQSSGCAVALVVIVAVASCCYCARVDVLSFLSPQSTTTLDSQRTSTLRPHTSTCRLQAGCLKGTSPALCLALPSGAETQTHKDLELSISIWKWLVKTTWSVKLQDTEPKLSLEYFYREILSEENWSIYFHNSEL